MFRLCLHPDETGSVLCLPCAEYILQHGNEVNICHTRPVSYTHLDVYKRQVQALRAEQIAPALRCVYSSALVIHCHVRPVHRHLRLEAYHREAKDREICSSMEVDMSAM